MPERASEIIVRICQGIKLNYINNYEAYMFFVLLMRINGSMEF